MDIFSKNVKKGAPVEKGAPILPILPQKLEESLRKRILSTSKVRYFDKINEIMTESKNEKKVDGKEKFFRVRDYAADEEMIQLFSPENSDDEDYLHFRTSNYFDSDRERRVSLGSSTKFKQTRMKMKKMRTRMRTNFFMFFVDKEVEKLFCEWFYGKRFLRDRFYLLIVIFSYFLSLFSPLIKSTKDHVVYFVGIQSIVGYVLTLIFLTVEIPAIRKLHRSSIYYSEIGKLFTMVKGMIDLHCILYILTKYHGYKTPLMGIHVNFLVCVTVVHQRIYALVLYTVISTVCFVIFNFAYYGVMKVYFLPSLIGLLAFTVFGVFYQYLYVNFRRKLFLIQRKYKKTKLKIENELQKEKKLLDNIIMFDTSNVITQNSYFVLKRSRHAILEEFEEISVLCCDVVDFKSIYRKTASSFKIIFLMNKIFDIFETSMKGYDLKPLKSDGDSIIISNFNVYDLGIIFCAFKIVEEVRKEEEKLMDLQVRLGVSVGKAILALVGDDRICNELFGEVMKKAKILERHSTSMKILIDDASREKIIERERCENLGKMFGYANGPIHNSYFIHESDKSKGNNLIQTSPSAEQALVEYKFRKKNIKLFRFFMSLKNPSYFRRFFSRQIFFNCKSQKELYRKELVQFYRFIPMLVFLIMLIGCFLELVSVEFSLVFSYSLAFFVRYVLIFLSLIFGLMFFVFNYTPYLRNFYFGIFTNAILLFFSYVYIFSIFLLSVSQQKEINEKFDYKIYLIDLSLIINNIVLIFCILIPFPLIMFMNFVSIFMVYVLLFYFKSSRGEKFILDLYFFNAAYLFLFTSFVSHALHRIMNSFFNDKMELFQIWDELQEKKVGNLRIIKKTLPYKLVDNIECKDQVCYQHFVGSVMFLKVYINTNDEGMGKDMPKVTSSLEEIVISDDISYVKKLNTIFIKFDQVLGNFKCTKIKSNWESYIVICDDIKKLISCGLSLIEICNEHKWSIKVGISMGDFTCGVIGMKTLHYEIFGEIIDFVHELCEFSENNKIHIDGNSMSCATERILGEVNEELEYEYEDTIADLDGFGETKTFLIRGAEKKREVDVGLRFENV